jgi:hypothetical protein
MASEDYLLRQFRLFAEVLAKIISKRKSGDLIGANQEIDYALSGWFKTDPDYQSLGKWVSSEIEKPQPDIESCTVFAELLYNKALLQSELGETDNSHQTAKEAVKLFEYIDKTSMAFSLDLEKKMEKLKTIFNEPR